MLHLYAHRQTFKAVLLLKMTQTIVAQKQSKLYLIYFENTSHTLDYLANCSFSS